MLCGKPGGEAATFSLRRLGYDVPGRGFAHEVCLAAEQRADRFNRERNQRIRDARSFGRRP
jgi:hypothetical protein